MRNVLVISTSEHPVAALRDQLGEDVGEVRVVVPTVRQSRLTWLTNADDDVREEADETASAIADALPTDAEGSSGDPDPLTAVEDALRQFPADEVVVVTRPDEEATWLEEGSSDAIARRVGGLPVRRLVVSDES
jgi:hypothetical protein